MWRDRVRRKAWVGIALLMAAATAAAASGQGQRGGAVGPSRAGTTQRITVHGKALERNSEGDSPDRNVTVYLPPSYASESARQFPVIYFLHDYGEQSDAPIDAIKQAADKLASVQGFSEPIIVTPDAGTSRAESMYSTSATAGNWESFVAEDLVAYIDMHYRTLASRISRGLAGHSRGGYGALRIGVKRPEVFSSMYIMSACCLDAADSPLTMLDQHETNFKKYYGISIDIGTKDPSLPLNQRLHNGLTQLRIPHHYEEFDGDHAGRFRERIERNLLPFFSKNLAAPANPTSPGVR
jgi:enterochelin esterase-like enzyme